MSDEIPVVETVDVADIGGGAAAGFADVKALFIAIQGQATGNKIVSSLASIGACLAEEFEHEFSDGDV